ncbi:MAG: hypothetical protein ACD_75C00637G0002, partial [uncultured bacterium]
WQLLYGNTPADEVCGEEFRQLCHEILCPIWRMADES